MANPYRNFGNMSKPWIASNIMVFYLDSQKKVVPFCVHGDGAEMYRDDEHFIVSWSRFSGGAYRDCLTCRFPISIVAERNMSNETDLCFNECKFFGGQRA